MASYLNKRMMAIPERKRIKADVTAVNKSGDMVRSMCVNATMAMLRGLYKLSDPVTYPDVARGMIAIANSTPIRCVCVGISPYGSGILPPFATALAYSPSLCIGPTPSVQVMSQIMGICASRMEAANVNRLVVAGTVTIKTPLEYASRFAMMLRCSYACTEAGVAFVNSSPVVTSSVAKTCMSMSLFSEWLANVVTIHGMARMKVTVVSMGASADRSINDAMSSYPGMSSNMNLFRMVNPAAVSRMSVTKIKNGGLVDDTITSAEAIIEAITGRERFPTPKVGYEWRTYSVAVLDKVVESSRVAHLVGLLADRDPDQLLNQFTSSIETLYAKMSEYDLESMMENMGVNENTDVNANAVYAETTVTSANANAGMMINPFENIETAASKSGGYSANQAPAQATNKSDNKSDGPYMFPRRSQIGQLLDPTGKGVSQQVIIIDSMNLRCAEIMTAYKEVNDNMKTVLERQSHLMDMMKKVGIIDGDTLEEAVEFVTSFEEFCGDIIEKMETAKGVMEAMPAVIEGDRGIYEHETMPVAPLLRRDDGSTMRQYVYGPAMRSADSTGTNAGITNTVTTNDAVNPFNVASAETVNSNANTVMNTNLVVTGDKRYNTIATTSLINTIRSFGFENGVTGPGAIARMKSYAVTIENFKTNLFEVMVTLVSQSMVMSEGATVKDDVMESIVACVGSMSDDDLSECSSALSDAVMSDTSVIGFISMLSDHGNGDSVDGADSDTEGE